MPRLILLLLAFLACSPAQLSAAVQAEAVAASAQLPEAPPDPQLQEAIERTAGLGAIDLATLRPEGLAADIVPLTKDELANLAAEALRLAQLRTLELVDERKKNPRRLPEASSPDQVQAYDDKMAMLLRQRSEAFDRLRYIVDEWEEKGGDPEEIAEFRAYRRAVIADSVSNLTLGGAWSALKSWAASDHGGLQVLKTLLLVILAVILLFLTARLIQSTADRLLSRRHRASRLLQTFLTLAVYWLVVLVGGALILVSLGFSIMPVFAVLGGVSFILAFALQETLGNFAAGLMILIYRPFDLGERVTVAGVSGKIRHLSLASTIVTTPDNQLVTIPNSKVWNDVIINSVDLDTRRVDLSFVIREPMKAMDAIEHLGELLSSLPEVLDEPAPAFFIGHYDGRGATLEIRPWVSSEEYAAARRTITRAIMRYFIDRKIELWVPAIEDQGSA